MTRADVVATLIDIIPGAVHRPAVTPLPYTPMVPVHHREADRLVAKQRGEWYLHTVLGR